MCLIFMSGKMPNYISEEERSSQVPWRWRWELRALGGMDWLPRGPHAVHSPVGGYIFWCSVPHPLALPMKRVSFIALLKSCLDRGPALANEI